MYTPYAACACGKVRQDPDSMACVSAKSNNKIYEQDARGIDSVV